jgi:hypothetical protein
LNMAGQLLCSSASALLAATRFSLALPRTWSVMAVAPIVRDTKPRRKRRRRRRGAETAETHVIA